jgi:hypothetical protein
LCQNSILMTSPLLAPSIFNPFGRRRIESSAAWLGGILPLTAATASLYGIDTAAQCDLVPSGAVTSTTGINWRAIRKYAQFPVDHSSYDMGSPSRHARATDERRYSTVVRYYITFFAKSENTVAGPPHAIGVRSYRQASGGSGISRGRESV